MKKITRYLLFIFVLSFLCMGCNKNGNNKEKQKANTRENVASTEENLENTTETMAISDDDTSEALEEVDYVAELMPEDLGEIIYVYVLDDESAKKISYFTQLYPQFEKQIEVRKLDVKSEDYTGAIKNMLQGNKDIPSVVMCQDDMLWDMIDAHVFKPLEEVGIREEMYSNAYDYTKNFAMKDNSLMAMTWDSNPGVFIYRSDIAEEVLGTSEPDEVQEYVKDWDSFFGTAELMKEKGYTMLSGVNDIVLPFVEQCETPLVDGKTLNIDENVVALFEVARYMSEEGYVAGNTMIGDEQWVSDNKDNVFGCFGSERTIDYYFNDVLEETYGKRKICEGPSNFHCGNSYIGITNKCRNEKLAAFLVYTLCCDKNVMYQICENENIFVNNREVIKTAVAEGKGAYETLGGQETYAVWDISSDSITIGSPTKYDDILINVLYDELDRYVNEELADVDAAVDRVKTKILEQCKELQTDN
ncbi:MAG: extracellular solute-binding protein [Lachnospiraceae bacterium]|nr:extracellular solute-binding protein [Lachnospiraceae bacterium]